MVLLLFIEKVLVRTTTITDMISDPQVTQMAPRIRPT